MAINFDQDRAGLLGIDTGVNYDQMAFKPGSFLDRQINKLNTLEQMGFPQPNLQKLKDRDMKQFKEKGIPLSLPEDQYAMAISNYDDLFDPQTMVDSLGVNRTISGLNRPDLNTAPFNVNEVSTDGITNNVRFRDMLLNDLRNLPSDFRTSLGQTKDAFLEDISGLTQGLGSLKDRGLDFLGLAKDKGIDLGRTILGGIGRLAAGPIGGILGSLIGSVKESPTDKFNLEIGKEFGDRYGYKGQLSSGTMGGRQDPFGRNLVSAFSNYEKNRMAEVARLSKLKELTQFQKDKLDFGKKYLQKLEQKRQAKIREMQDKNRADRRGGYQSSFAQDKDFMEGPSGAGYGMGAADKGGSDTMGSF